VIDLQSYAVRTPGVVGQVVEDEAVVVLPERGAINVLNEVGARIWELADGSRRVVEIISTICEEYEVDAAQAEADALVFLGDLATRGVIMLVPTQEETTGAA
jgi:hypothetical protein